ncbi:RsfA family transcriptional regulator [Ferviditalea candida]|uniref:RsfA family transcriptional regulator n=1 Tax=Ferviditalea candida TaxID=3108399 RepID=A0ABU5ZG33_9BACL|nr:RsfA family transcriptional regulator [Paenibacillaceae bacterium T2]
MAVTRQDAWSTDDDLILAEVTLRHIREGGTQLGAFEEVGERIGRTAAACGFRWNSCVRKKYEAAIQIAKSQRQKRNQQKKQLAANRQMAVISTLGEDEAGYDKHDSVFEESLSIDAVIRFLRQWKATVQEYSRKTRGLEKELKEKDEELERLRSENERLLKEVNNVQTDYRVVNDDYKALIQIMDRARKMALLVEEDDNNKPRFKMDANGNLERIE